MKKKYIFLDIDGTLVCGGQIPDDAIDALRLARDNGHELVICTGRSMYEIQDFVLEAFDFDGIVSSSGSRVVRGDKAICHYISAEETEELCEYFTRRQIPYTVMTAEMTYAEGDALRSLIAGQTGLVDKAEGKAVCESCHAEGVEQIDFYCGKEMCDEVAKEFGGRFNVVPGEITPKGISKASGIREYIQLCGGDVSDTVAFGDSENDLEMISFAGIGVAMGNACAELKEIADIVTDPVYDAGLKKGFEKAGLI